MSGGRAGRRSALTRRKLLDLSGGYGSHDAQAARTSSLRPDRSRIGPDEDAPRGLRRRRACTERWARRGRVGAELARAPRPHLHSRPEVARDPGDEGDPLFFIGELRSTGATEGTCIRTRAGGPWCCSARELLSRASERHRAGRGVARRASVCSAHERDRQATMLLARELASWRATRRGAGSAVRGGQDRQAAVLLGVRAVAPGERAASTRRAVAPGRSGWGSHRPVRSGSSRCRRSCWSDTPVLLDERSDGAAVLVGPLIRRAVVGDADRGCRAMLSGTVTRNVWRDFQKSAEASLTNRQLARQATPQPANATRPKQQLARRATPPPAARAPPDGAAADVRGLHKILCRGELHSELAAVSHAARILPPRGSLGRGGASCASVAAVPRVLLVDHGEHLAASPDPRAVSPGLTAARAAVVHGIVCD